MSVRVLFVVDPVRHREEASALRRFGVGLAAEGHRPAMVLGIDGHPHPEDHAVIGPVPTVESPIDVPWWLRERTAEAVLSPLSSARLDQPDVVVAVGRRAIALASAIAGPIEALLMLEARDRRDAEAADHRFAAVVTASPALRDLASRRVGPEKSIELPVPVPRSRADLPRDHGLAVVLGPVGDMAAWTAMCEGLAGPGGTARGLRQVAVELSDRVRDGVIWRRMRNSPLMELATTFEHADRLRDPLTTADVVLVPDAGGPVRSLERQAVARGALVISVEDPMRTDRRDGFDAHLLSRSEARRPESWRSAVEAALATAPCEASIHAGRASLVSSVAPRWAALLTALVHGDAVPIGHARDD